MVALRRSVLPLALCLPSAGCSTGITDSRRQGALRAVSSFRALNDGGISHWPPSRGIVRRAVSAGFLAPLEFRWSVCLPRLCHPDSLTSITRAPLPPRLMASLTNTLHSNPDSSLLNTAVFCNAVSSCLAQVRPVPLAETSPFFPTRALAAHCRRARPGSALLQALVSVKFVGLSPRFHAEYLVVFRWKSRSIAAGWLRGRRRSS